MYRVTNRFVLIDIRLLKGIGVPQNSVYNIQFEGGRVEATVPYVVNDADAVAEFILRLKPKPKALRGTGYFHQIATEVESSKAEVCMTILLVQKGSTENGATEIDLGDLPIDFSVFGS
jgi:hypothetical protein